MFGLNNDGSIQGLNAAGELLCGTNKLRVSPTIGPSREALNAGTQKLMAQLDHKIFKLAGMEIMKCVSHLTIWLANTPPIRDPPKKRTSEFYSEMICQSMVFTSGNCSSLTPNYPGIER